MMHIKKTTLKDLKQLRNQAEDLRKQEYLKKFGPIQDHVPADDLIDQDLDEFY